MKALFSVPNLLSLGNLLCGCIAILNVLSGNYIAVVILLMIACVCDFLDGFAARGPKQGSPMGKELDSLADMVTFGVLPGMVMFQMLRFTHEPETWGAGISWRLEYLPYIGFIIPLFSGLRLAKFNVDTRQSESFIGLPTLANALFVCGLPMFFNLLNSDVFWNGWNIVVGSTQQMILGYSYEPSLDVPQLIRDFFESQAVLAVLCVIFSVLLISPLPMFSFKIKSVKWKGNEIRYIFLALAIALAIWLKLAALPLIIVTYIIMSVIYALRKRTSQQPS